MVERLKPQLAITPVSWDKPTDEVFKLNVDGCFKGNPGSAGCGGILRDHLGQLIIAFSSYLGVTTNNYAEAQAIKTGLIWCIDHGFNTLEIESDSLILIKMIKNDICASWEIKDFIDDIHSMLAHGSFQFNHILREGNIPADLLANLTEHDKINAFFNDIISLPRKIIAILENDTRIRPNFRIRVRKNTFIFDPG
ncbi:uncharacterized protein [Nicotiana tomentosiformis]|uniref:uncharacterized protein n=1 Tax=Nicotiana tomentosiformis TaxID=4098 RepID=UPI00388C3515